MVVGHRSFRYRIYPTAEQEARLWRWESALRTLWNTANEQRLLSLRRGSQMPSAFDQINELTDLRSDVPWQADIPRNAAAQLLVNLDAAWQRCFTRLSNRPRWKKKGRDRVSITEPHSKAFHLTADGVVFPKLGEIKALLAAAVLVVLPGLAEAHPGRLDKTGCHVVRHEYVYKDGRTLPKGDRHCHRPLGELRLDEERFDDETKPTVPAEKSKGKAR